MNDIETALLGILAAEASGGRCDGVCPALSVADMGRLMRLAEVHAVAGVVAHAVEQGVVTIEDAASEGKGMMVMSIMKVLMTHRRNYLRFESAVEALGGVLKSAGVPYVVFKGVAVARRYRVPEVRTMGDVDFYVPRRWFGVALGALRREWHVAVDEDDTDKHYAFDRDGIRFEMHYQIETFGSAAHQRRFNAMVDGCLPMGHGVLPPLEDLVVVFKHWFNHLLVEGVGLRQTLDLAVLLRAYSGVVDRDRLAAVLRGIGYHRAFRAMLAMQERWLGVDVAERYCRLSAADRRRGDRLMSAVMESGNFGRKAYRHRSSGCMKSMETAVRALRHCVRFFWLAPWDIVCLVPRRIWISLKK